MTNTLTKTWLPTLAMVIATGFWGSSFFTVGNTLEYTNPMMLLALRFGCGSLLVMLLMGKKLLTIPRSTWKAGAICAIVIFCAYFCNTYGLLTIESSASGFLTALYVPLTPLLMWIYYSRAPKPSSILGVGIAFIGLVLLANPFEMTFSKNIGEIVTIVSALLSALEIIVVGIYAPKCDARQLAFTQLVMVTLYSALGLLVLSVLGIEQKETVFSTGLWMGILWLACVVAVVQVLLSWAQRYVPPERAAIIFAMESVFAAIIGYIAGERLGISGFVGGGLIVAAVLISELTVVNQALERWFKRDKQKSSAN